MSQDHTRLPPTRGEGQCQKAPKIAAVAAVCCALAACYEGSASSARGFLLAQGFDHPIIRWTSGDFDIDDKACDGKATLYAFVADNGSGLLCGGERIWIVAGGLKASQSPVTSDGEGKSEGLMPTEPKSSAHPPRRQ